MPRIIKEIKPLPKLEKRIRAAAYARVSSGKDAMLHSLSAQVAYYSNLIQKHSGWEYVGVYADEALTGTKDNRDEFQRMIKDCRAGKIDIVITKSISRFARNTVTLLETVRELKRLGIDVYFEEQNIHTMSADGELMLTILASYAQEESLSASENQRWRIKRNFEEGKPWSYKMLGYRRDGDMLGVVEDEAETVRLIYALYLGGVSLEGIRKRLLAESRQSPSGSKWSRNGIAGVLTNYAYTGNLLLQRTYRIDHISKKTVSNKGEMPLYHVQNSHEAIIPLETYEAVQTLFQARANAHPAHGTKKKSYPFTGVVKCGTCGHKYRRKTTKTGIVWICETYNLKGKQFCPSKQIPEETLTAMSTEVLGVDALTAEALKAAVKSIEAYNGNRVVFTLADGSKIEKQWQDRSRSESWTAEMRELAGQKTKRRYQQNG